MLGQEINYHTSTYKIVIAGPEYDRPKSFQKLWGINRRKEWTTPVSVPVLWLDSVYGGLQPYKVGGGNETRSLRLRSAQGKEFALRSINKSRQDVVPPVMKNTFVEEIIKDGISMSHPYAALALTYMEEKAGIYHTIPLLVYLPHQASLDTFDKKFGDDLYLFEQRPEGDWHEADHLGNFTEFISTEDILKEILKDNNHLADQETFVKARLFDMLISDWDRHEDNWEWGKRVKQNITYYIPVPKDRDQALYTHDGILIDKVLAGSGLSFMQNFDSTMDHMEKLNYEEKYFDRFFTNELSREDWMRAATELLESLTDDVIEQSVRKLPPEIYQVSGKQTVQTLRSRLKDLPNAASSYYSFIAEQVDITGSKQREYFQVRSLDDDNIIISIYRMDEGGKKESSPYYERTLKPTETREVRLYGIGGRDQFSIINRSNRIRIRVIGGPDRDSIAQEGTRIHLYDNQENDLNIKSARLHLSRDTSVHEFKYDWYEYNSKGISPTVSYNYEDRFYVGLNYTIKKNKWRREPFHAKHRLGLNYSFSQNALSASYDGLYPNVIGKWNVLMHADYDFERWTNFFGFGNETTLPISDKTFYRMNSADGLVRAGLSRQFGRSYVEIQPFFKSVDIKSDTTIYAVEIFGTTKPNMFEANHYAGLNVSYSYLSINDSIVPTKGISFLVDGQFAKNFGENDFFQKYEGRLQGFIPLSNKFSILTRVGGVTIVGPASLLNHPQTFQHAVIGGPESLRGYRFDRFWGRTSFYNNNELRFITNLKTYVLNAKIGLKGFFDDGRVWMPGENSETLHTSYGAGVLFAPFNFVCLDLTYGISNESKLWQFKISTLF